MNQKNYIGAVIVLALVVAIAAWVNSRPSSYQWEVNLRDKKYEPYDLGLFVDVLRKTYDEDFELITRNTPFELAADSGSGTMLYLENDIYLSQDHEEKILGFMERGNHVIFCSDFLPQRLIEKVTGIDFDVEYSERMEHKSEFKDFLFSSAAQNDYNEESELDIEDEEFQHHLYLEDSLVTSYFNSEPEKNYSFKFIQKDTVETYLWHGIDSVLLSEYQEQGDLKPLAVLNDSLSYFFSSDYGEGKLFIHMNPVMFSNIYFKEKSGFEYASEVLNYRKEGKMYLNHHYQYVNLSTPDYDYGEKATSPMTFILKHDALKWTFYAILIASVIYLLFSFKRRLPVIKHFDFPKNTSLSYVKVLSSFYLSAKDHGILCTEMMANFNYFLRSRYKLKTNLDKEELIPLIVKSSGLNEQEVSSIFDTEFKINYSNDSKSKGLVTLYQHLEHFYSNCK